MTTKITPEYNLQALYPEIARQWHPTLNGDLTPDKVAPKSNKKRFWLCEKGHTWSAAVNSRHVAGCRRCWELARYVAVDRTLRDYPHLLAELDPKNPTGLEDVYVGSSELARWICSICNQRWVNQIRKRAINGQGCPYCAGKKVAPNGWNSLEAKFQQLADEWDHTKNSKKPSEISPGTHKMAQWRCSRGHEYSATVKSRTELGTGCPLCSYGVSKPQKRLFAELAIAFPSVSVALEQKIGTHRVDLAIPELKIAIEYDGARYHKGLKKSESDARKTRALRELGFRLIRVREFGLLADPEAHCVMLPKVYKLFGKESVDQVVRMIIQLCGDRVSTNAAIAYLDAPSFQAEEAYQLIARKKRLDEETLAHQNPELAAEWSPKNADSPSDVTPGSDERRWWDCRACSWSWLAAIGSRNLGHGCPNCADKVPTETKNLAVVFPLVAERLHPTRNGGKTGADFTPYSNLRVWWRCSRGHEYEAVVSNQVKSKIGCEQCLGKKATSERSLATEYPHVAVLLNEERSGVKASEIPPHSGKPYWWRCESGHEWERTADRQTRGKGGCPLCRGKWIPRSCAD